MAAGKDSERMTQALRSLREARGELTGEARWLRQEFRPGRVAHRAVDNHTTGALCTAFAAGLFVAWVIFHRRGKDSPARAFREQRHPVAPQRHTGVGLAATLLKAAIPLALKFATSKPVLNKIINLGAARRARPARHTMSRAA